VRFVRSAGEERLQLKWFAAAAVLVVATFIALILTNSNSAAAAILNNLALLCLDAAIAIAVLKYRLYDIDRIISRTLAYAIVTGLLVGVYAGLVLLATQVLTLKSPVAVAGSTLVAAALFSPLRSRVQRAVDRRFNRARYDADQMVAAFAARLKDAVDLDAVQADWLAWFSRRWSPLMSHCGGTTAGKVPDPVPESSGHILGAAVESGCPQQALAARPVTGSMLVIDLVRVRARG
jgi:hypothetical protein